MLVARQSREMMCAWVLWKSAVRLLEQLAMYAGRFWLRSRKSYGGDGETRQPEHVKEYVLERRKHSASIVPRSWFFSPGGERHAIQTLRAGGSTYICMVLSIQQVFQKSLSNVDVPAATTGSKLKLGTSRDVLYGRSDRGASDWRKRLEATDVRPSPKRSQFLCPRLSGTPASSHFPSPRRLRSAPAS